VKIRRALRRLARARRCWAAARGAEPMAVSVSCIASVVALRDVSGAIW
jgi:hypothetical protein